METAVPPLPVPFRALRESEKRVSDLERVLNDMAAQQGTAFDADDLRHVQADLEAARAWLERCKADLQTFLQREYPDESARNALLTEVLNLEGVQKRVKAELGWIRAGIWLETDDSFRPVVHRTRARLERAKRVFGEPPSESPPSESPPRAPEPAHADEDCHTASEDSP